MSDTPARLRFSRDDVDELLAALDRRLRARDVAVAVFVVGGAAIAASGMRDGRLTEDVDAISTDPQVTQEAAALARERSLPEDWLNPRARMWMPPMPEGVLDPPSEPGLRVTYAEDDFLLATKLVAQRAKDADDVLALASKLGLEHATAATLEAHIRRFYTDLGALELILHGSDVDTELAALAHDAARLLSRGAARPR